MEFPGFLGNDGLKARLSAAFSQGAVSHCYLLVGPAGSGKRTLARILAAAMECDGTPAPCGHCPSCHKIFGGGHPDVITVDSDKATIPIAIVREMQADAYIRPNEGRRKVYLIPRAGDMLPPAQNALLKLIEEPPAYCSFLLLTDAVEKLLPTVRSRAVELKLSPLSDQVLLSALRQKHPETDAAALGDAALRSGGYLGAAETILAEQSDPFAAPLAAFTEALCSRDELRLSEVLVPAEKWKRPDFLAFTGRLDELLVRALAKKKGGAMAVSKNAARLAASASGQLLERAADAVRQARLLLLANGSSGHAAGYLLTSILDSGGGHSDSA